MPVPVIVVGNLTVGGTGKSPLVIALVEQLREKGFKPGVVSRGYGGQATDWPQKVTADSNPFLVGDEPVMIATYARCPVVAAPNRVVAAQSLLTHFDCDIIVSDDGLQHYALARDIEILVVDESRGFGNGFCLPAGPLREPVSRAAAVDCIVMNCVSLPEAAPTTKLTAQPHRMKNNGVLFTGHNCSVMKIIPRYFTPLYAAKHEEHLALNHFKGKTVRAVTGIGNPGRFFATLSSLGVECIEHPYPDHHRFKIEDLAFDDDMPIIMTMKDAVKCRRLLTPGHLLASRCYVLNVVSDFDSLRLLNIPKMFGN